MTASERTDCFSACRDTRDTALRTLAHCLEGGEALRPAVVELLACAKLCEDCADACLARSPSRTTAAEACAEACDRSAAACDRYSDLQLRQCAEVCRYCARACYRLVYSLAA